MSEFNDRREVNMYSPLPDFKAHEKEFNDAISKVLNHGLFINGPEVKTLEDKLASFVGSKHCICVGNGTDALQIALMALDIGYDDEVITVAHTWISTAEVIALVGAKPVFVDIEDQYFNIDINKIEEAITPKTKAIMPVSLYGQTPDMDRINEIAEKHGLHVIEDGAQSFGATYKGRKSCSLSTIGTTSFFPSKPLGCYGDGGACFTNDDHLGMKMRAIKNHGGVKRFHHQFIGTNSRLDTLQAAILEVKFSYFDRTIEERQNIADRYIQQLRPLEEQGLLQLPKTDKVCTHVWAQFSILLTDEKERDRVFNEMKSLGINLAIFYPAPLHLQECFKYLEYKIGTFPVTEQVCNRIINLPCYGELELEEQDFVINKFIICVKK